VQPIAMTIVGDMFPPEERARIQGVFGAVWGVAAIVGPILGGLIVRAFSWRWVFYLNVPFGLLAMALLATSLGPRPASVGGRRPIDIAGAALLSTAVLALLAGGGGPGPLVSPRRAGVALVFLLLVGRSPPEPLLPMDL